MFNVCVTYSETDDEAADILQEAFIRVFRKIGQFRGDCPLEAWIRKIIVNTALEIYRKKSREKAQMQLYTQVFEEETEDVIGDLNRREIIELINQLPFKAQLVLKLYAIEGYNHREIAEMMDITEGTSKSQLNRARFLVKQAMMKRDVV